MKQDYEYTKCANRSGTGQARVVRTHKLRGGQDRVTISWCDACGGLCDADDRDYIKWLAMTGAERAKQF